MKQILNKKIYIVIAFVLVLLLLGGTYAFFNYTRTGQANTLSAAKVDFSVSDENNLIDISNEFPMDAGMTLEEMGNEANAHTGTVSITGHTTLTKGIGYKIYLLHGDDISGKQRLNDENIKFQLTPNFTSGSNGFTVKSNNYSSPTNLSFDNEGKALLSTGLVKDTTQLTTVTYNYSFWIDGGSLNISSTTKRETLPEGNPSLADATEGNTTATRYMRNDNTEPTTETLFPANSYQEGKTIYTTYEFANGYYNIKILVEATEYQDTGEDKVRKSITEKINATTNSCNPIWVDDNGTASDTSDDITYFSGTNDCVDMNYVWYSGKLWRITAIYPDGAMKLVTEDVITSIYWGSDTEYDGSWVYQWLNEDFYDTLYNANSIIESNSTWNYSTDENSTPVKPETIETQKTKTAPVGLLNVYEYYNAYRNSSTSANYLNIGYYWWLITPYSSSAVRFVSNLGTLSKNSPSEDVYGVRPSINLKSGLEFTGIGTKTSPYEIVGDKEDAVNNTTLLSSRAVGEYVKFDNDLYRIVDTTNGITKLTRVDYLRDAGTAVTKNFASSAYFGKSSNTQSDDYWDYYLNNTWYNSISSEYKSMLVDGTYYLGLYPSNTNYKATICKDADLNSVTTKTCSKYTSSDTDKTFTGKVGLPRVGEMFSSQLGSGYSTSSYMWLITPYSTSSVRYVNFNGALNSTSPSSNAYGVRSSINLKSGIKITGGTGYVGGDVNSPFEISE